MLQVNDIIHLTVSAERGERVAMLGAMGTPHNIATFDSLFEANVPSLLPLTGAVSMYEPLHPMKFSFFASYRDQNLPEVPAAQSVIGYVIADLLIKALEGAGPDVTVEKTLAAMEGITRYENPFGAHCFHLARKNTWLVIP